MRAANIAIVIFASVFPFFYILLTDPEEEALSKSIDCIKESSLGNYNGSLLGLSFVKTVLPFIDSQKKMYRLVNIVLHTENSILLFSLVLFYLGTQRRYGSHITNLCSTLMAVFFALHPARIESLKKVDYENMSNILATTFVLLAVLLGMILLSSPVSSKQLHYVLASIASVLLLVASYIDASTLSIPAIFLGAVVAFKFSNKFSAAEGLSQRTIAILVYSIPLVIFPLVLYKDSLYSMMIAVSPQQQQQQQQQHLFHFSSELLLAQPQRQPPSTLSSPSLYSSIGSWLVIASTAILRTTGSALKIVKSIFCYPQSSEQLDFLQLQLDIKKGNLQQSRGSIYNNGLHNWIPSQFYEIVFAASVAIILVIRSVAYVVHHKYVSNIAFCTVSVIFVMICAGLDSFDDFSNDAEEFTEIANLKSYLPSLLVSFYLAVAFADAWASPVLPSASSGVEAVVLTHEKLSHSNNEYEYGPSVEPFLHLLSSWGLVADSYIRDDDNNLADRGKKGAAITRAATPSAARVASVSSSSSSNSSNGVVSEELVRFTPSRPTLANAAFKLLILGLVVLFLQTSIRCRHPEIKCFVKLGARGGKFTFVCCPI